MELSNSAFNNLRTSSLSSDDSERTTLPSDSPDSGVLGAHEVKQSISSARNFSLSENSFFGTEPAHSDPLQLANLTNNVVSDTATYVTIVPWAFDIPLENGVAAGILSNVAGAIVNSSYLTEKAVALLPDSYRESVRSGAKAFDEGIRTYTHPPYLAYYVAAWCALKVTTVPKICAFILLSSFVRQAAKYFLESERSKGTLVEQAEALTSAQQVDPAVRALIRAMRDFTPELVAALARSGFSNFNQYAEGKQTANEVFSKTLFSGAIFTVAMFMYYVGYRALEQAEQQRLGVYNKAAASDGEKIQELKSQLENTNFMSASDQEVKDKAVALSKAFSFLSSPLTSLFKDPIYRAFMKATYFHRENPNSREAVQAFQAIDIVGLLQKFVESFKTRPIQQEQREAFQKLLTALGVHVDLEQASSQDLGLIENNALDALHDMFQKYSATSSPSLLASAERGGLLTNTHDATDYGSTRSQEV